MDTEDQVLFIRRDALGSLPDLLDHPRVRRIAAVERVLKSIHEDYVLGPPLGAQRHARDLRRKIRRAAHFLRAVGLIDPDLIAATQPHMSIVLLTASALGIDDDHYDWLVPFFENPGGLLARAIASSLDPRRLERNEFAAKVEGALWDVAEGYPDRCQDTTGMPDSVQFKSPQRAVELLENLANRYQDVTARVGALANYAQSCHGSGSVSLGGKGEVVVRDDQGRWRAFEAFVEAGDKELAEELKILERERPRLMRDHAGKFVLIRRAEDPTKGPTIEIRGTEEEALDEGYRCFGDEPFLVEYLGDDGSRNVILA